jgi:transcriptional regulator with XRE-family HTH domain
MDARTPGERLKIARLAAGLTQGQLAGMLDMHPMSISSIEVGKRRLTFDVAFLVAKATGVPVSALLPDVAWEVARELHAGAQRTVTFTWPKFVRPIRCSPSTDRDREIWEEAGGDIPATLAQVTGIAERADLTVILVPK